MLRGKIHPVCGRLYVAGVLLFAAGCGSGGGVPATEEAAREALGKALGAWKSGTSAEAMRQQSPEVVVGDSDWKQGRRLTGYEIGGGSFDGKNLRVPVTLTMSVPPRGQRKLIINYIVGTSPVVTVFRDSD
jgi:hypothetical protein